MKQKDLREKIAELLFRLTSYASVLGLGGILFFLLLKGVPPMLRYGVGDFLTGTVWHASKGEFGVFPMLLTTVLVSLGALLFAVPLGIGTAIFLHERAPKRLASLVRPGVELLAGIPSVVYGFVGLVLLVPWLHSVFGGGGDSLFAAMLLLSVMILPTIVATAETALAAVPKSHKEGALALGASPMQSIFQVQIPAAKSGILTGIILALGRALGETMAVILVIGNSVALPKSLLSRGRTLTGNIAMEMGYATSEHQGMLFASGVVLLVMIMLLSGLLQWQLRRRS